MRETVEKQQNGEEVIRWRRSRAGKVGKKKKKVVEWEGSKIDRSPRRKRRKERRLMKGGRRLHAWDARDVPLRR